jgi:hypothetical protein
MFSQQYISLFSTSSGGARFGELQHHPRRLGQGPGVWVGLVQGLKSWGARNADFMVFTKRNGDLIMIYPKHGDSAR